MCPMDLLGMRLCFSFGVRKIWDLYNLISFIGENWGMIAPFVELQVGLNHISTSMPVDWRKKGGIHRLFLGQQQTSGYLLTKFNNHGDSQQTWGDQTETSSSYGNYK